MDQVAVAIDFLPWIVAIALAKKAREHCEIISKYVPKHLHNNLIIQYLKGLQNS